MQNTSISEIQALFKAKKVSPVELCQTYLERIKQHDGLYNSFISIDEIGAINAAKDAQTKIESNQATPLTGIPIAHKDIFCTKGMKTSCGSKILDNFISPYDATVVSKLQLAGSVNLGKTNMDEFAMGSANVTSYYGSVKNPWDQNTVPGGSSGGSAAAVAANFCVAATGTDTGGSIRQPAAFCGITGIKPTYGSISRYGLVAFASSLDQAGPMAKSAEDVAIMLEHMVGIDKHDSTSVAHPNPNFSKQLNNSIDGLKIGLPKEYFSSELDPAIAASIQQCAETFEKQGATLVDISLNYTDKAVPCYYIIAPAEASSNLSRYDGIRFGYRADDVSDLKSLYVKTRSEGFGDEVKRRIMIGTYALSSGYFDAYYVQAQKIRRLIRDEFIRAFNEVDVILAPTTPSTAFQFDNIKQHDPVQMYLADLYTIAVNLAGLPALSMPCGFHQNLPVGAQLIGKHFEDGKLLNVAHQYQKQTNFHQQSPVLAKGGAS